MSPTDITPSFAVAVKLASVAVHADELLDSIAVHDGVAMDADQAAIRTLLGDLELQAYLRKLGKFALIPVKR